jgi:glycosyltransferase involved in cell wall biosynthesis
MVRELGIGGCERDLTKIAIGLDRGRFEPHIACLSPDGPRSSELRAARVPIIALPTRSLISRSLIQGAKLLGRYIREHRIQLAHAFDAPMEFIGLPICRLYGVPGVIKSHLWYRNMTQPRYRMLFAMMDRITDAIVVNSEAARNDLTSYGVPVSKTYLCNNGVDTATFHPRPDETPMEAVRDASLVIGCVCAIRQEKRLDLLMKAFARVQTLCPGMKLLLVGSGPLQSEIEKLRTELGLTDVCHMAPTQEDVATWMRSIDIFVQASDSESFPNALLEAMACGCCIVASRVGGIPELVTDKEDGLLFAPGNVDDLVEKLTCVIQKEDLRSTLAAKAVKKAAERFPIRKTVDRMQFLYESIWERQSKEKVIRQIVRPEASQVVSAAPNGMTMASLNEIAKELRK